MIEVVVWLLLSASNGQSSNTKIEQFKTESACVQVRDVMREKGYQNNQKNLLS